MQWNSWKTSWADVLGLSKEVDVHLVSASMSGTLRRDKLMNIALTLPRSVASLACRAGVLLVHLVEGAGDLADLVGGVHVDGLDLGLSPCPVDLAHPADHRRQPLFGYVECPVPQPAQRSHHGPADDDSGGQRDAEQQDDREAEDDRQR